MTASVRLVQALLCLLACAPPLFADQQQPNILILMAEDLSPRIGAFGDPVAQTPNIDRLASVGVGWCMRPEPGRPHHRHAPGLYRCAAHAQQQPA